MHIRVACCFLIYERKRDADKAVKERQKGAIKVDVKFIEDTAKEVLKH